MKYRRVRAFLLTIMFIFAMTVFLYGISTNLEAFASINRIFSDTVDNSKKIDISLKKDIEKAIYEYLKEYNTKKIDAFNYSYLSYEKTNIDFNVYKETKQFINATQKYSEKEYKLYKDLNDFSNKDQFIKHLKNEKAHNALIKYLNKNVDSFFINDNLLNNIGNNDEEKFDHLLTYLTYLDNNTSRWYYVNKIIVCKDEQMLKIIEEKNKELNLDIKIVLENDKEENVKKIPVLMYHGVSDVTWGIANLFMKVNDFENQLKYIHDNYETIFVEDIDKFGSKKEVVLTFDDGYVDFYTNVFPLLKKYNIKANLYVIDNADGGVYLSKSQIKEIAESNLVSIGSHTETHVNLANLDSEQLEYELKESKSNIEKLIGKEVKTICYPLGAYNDKVLEAASKYYDYGLIIENGVQKMYDDYNKLAIRRFRVYRNTGFSSFKNMVDQAN